jgi:hypothetical protein
VRNRIGAIFVFCWGVLIVLGGIIRGIPLGNSSYDAGGFVAFLFGIVLLLAGGHALFRTTRARLVGLVVLVGAIVLGAAGCGGALSDEARRADCERDFAAGVLSKRSDFPAGLATRTAERLCGELASRDLIAAADDDAYFAVLREEPDIMQPFCDHAVKREFELAPATVRALALTKDVQSFSGGYCRRAVEAGFVQLGRSPSPVEVDQLYAAHPQLARQACFLIFMGDARDLRLRGTGLAHAKKATRRYCKDMVARNLLDWAGDGYTAAQERDVAALCQRYVTELTRGRESCSA